MFHSCGLGLVHGNQTAGRGELLAITTVVEDIVTDQNCSSADIYTDAQYVINTVSRFPKNISQDLTYKFPNADLNLKLQHLWNQKPIRLYKLKSHRKIHEALDSRDLWNLLGNKMADLGATTVLEQLPEFILSLSKSIAEFHEQEKTMLFHVMTFYADLNRTIVTKVAEISKQQQTQNEEVGNHQNLMLAKYNGDLVFEFLETFDQPAYKSLEGQVLEQDAYHACFQGANLARAVHQWCESLRWPTDILDNPGYNRKDDWGISWLELLFNFCFWSQMCFPIRKSGRSIDSCYISFNSEEALLAYAAKRAVHMQTLCMEGMIRSLENLQDKEIFPSFDSNQCKSLIRFGYNGKHTGIPCRPIMLYPKETMQWVRKYMHQARIKGSLTDPFKIPMSQPCIVCDHIEELSAEERWKKYFQQQDIKRRASKAAKNGS